MLMRSSGSEHKHPEARHLCAPRQRQQQRAAAAGYPRLCASCPPPLALLSPHIWAGSVRLGWLCRVNSRNDDTPEKLRLRKKAPQGETHREKVLNSNHCAESTAGGAPEHGDGVISRGREMRGRRIKEREVKWRYEFSPSQKTGLKPQQLQHSTQFMWTRLTCTSHTLYTLYTLYYTVYSVHTVHSLSEDPLYMQYSHTEETDTRTVYMRTRFIVSVQHHWVHTSLWCTHTQFTWVSALHALQWWKQ